MPHMTMGHIGNHQGFYLRFLPEDPDDPEEREDPDPLFLTDPLEELPTDLLELLPRGRYTELLFRPELLLL